MVPRKRFRITLYVHYLSCSMWWYSSQLEGDEEICLQNSGRETWRETTNSRRTSKRMLVRLKQNLITCDLRIRKQSDLFMKRFSRIVQTLANLPFIKLGIFWLAKRLLASEREASFVVLVNWKKVVIFNMYEGHGPVFRETVFKIRGQGLWWWLHHLLVLKIFVPERDEEKRSWRK